MFPNEPEAGLLDLFGDLLCAVEDLADLLLLVSTDTCCTDILIDLRHRSCHGDLVSGIVQASNFAWCREEIQGDLRVLGWCALHGEDLTDGLDDVVSLLGEVCLVCL